MLHFTEYGTRVAAYAVLTRPDEILLTWFNGAAPCWSLPGGGVEFEESIEEAVVREVKEETGYDVVLGPPIGTDSFTHTDPDRSRPFKSVRILFDAQIVGGVLGTLEVGGSTDRAEWIRFDDLDAQPLAGIVDVAVSLLGSP